MEKVAENQMFVEFLADVGKMVLFFDESGQVCYANDMAKQELGIEGEVYPNISRLLPDCQNDKMNHYMFSKVHRGEKMQLTMYRLNHTCFPADVSFGLLSKYSRGFCIATDQFAVTELKHEVEHAENEIKQLRDMRNDFVANVTHELRTPLNGIKGHMEQLISSGEASKQQQRTFRIIERCCLNMAYIIDNLLDFSKLESGRFQLEETEFSFEDCMRQVLETNEIHANEKGIHFSVHAEDDIPSVLIGDGMHLQQILNNLVSNAIKFTENGFVKVKVIKVYQIGKKVELFFVVVDSGIGISIEQKDKIFESFTQADASITRKYGGTGLGLAITKDLVQMMGGTINLESQVGKGSTFSFSLIMQDPAAQLDAKKEAKMDAQHIMDELDKEREKEERMYQAGTADNREQLRINMEKMIICIEMENWEKAEMFSTIVKKLLGEAEHLLKKQAFQLQMAVRREDYDKSTLLYEGLLNMLKPYIEGTA